MNHIISKGAIPAGDLLLTLPTHAERHYASVDFFNDAALTSPVDKATMSGTVTFEVSENGLDFSYGSVNNGVLTIGTTSYNRPYFSGSILKMKVNFNSVVGASHFKIVVASYGG